jgi:FtsP/CotA-like multicopper oxidase with cupredoxin domain
MKWFGENKVLSAALAAAAVLMTPSSAVASGRLMRHDASWQPEYVLEATAQNITVNCQSRYSTVFNGTSPGPTLHLQEGKTSWVRVWNRIEDNNVTVVCAALSPCSSDANLVLTSINSTGTA